MVKCVYTIVMWWSADRQTFGLDSTPHTYVGTNSNVRISSVCCVLAPHSVVREQGITLATVPILFSSGGLALQNPNTTATLSFFLSFSHPLSLCSDQLGP